MLDKVLIILIFKKLKRIFLNLPLEHQFYIILHKFDVICLSETDLHSNIPTNYDKFEIPGYTLICCDHPSNTKRDGVGTYYRSSFVRS